MTGKIPNKFLDRITTTLGSVAALAWNEAIQLLFRQLLSEAGGRWPPSSFYTFIVTG